MPGVIASNNDGVPSVGFAILPIAAAPPANSPGAITSLGILAAVATGNMPNVSNICGLI